MLPADPRVLLLPSDFPRLQASNQAAARSHICCLSIGIGNAKATLCCYLGLQPAQEPDKGGNSSIIPTCCVHTNPGTTPTTVQRLCTTPTADIPPLPPVVVTRLGPCSPGRVHTLTQFGPAWSAWQCTSLCHTHNVTHTMSHTQCHTHNVTHTMSHTQCHTHNVTHTFECHNMDAGSPAMLLRRTTAEAALQAGVTTPAVPDWVFPTLKGHECPHGACCD
jgi:hypothetical protein